MENYKLEPLKNNVDEMFIGPFGSSLKNDCFVDEDEAFCMVYEQKHAIQKTMDVDTRYVNEKKYNELKRFNVHGGDIIVSCRGTIGETYIVPDDAPLGIMHPSIMKIRLKEGVYDKRYFNDLLYTRLKKHEVEANGSGVKMAISANKLGEELFPVPSIQQQKEIERKLKLVRKLIDQREEELSALDELIKARFVELFGDPIKNTKSLNVKRLEELGTWNSGGTPSRTKSEFFTGDINWYSAGELNSLYLHGSIEKITAAAIEESAAKLFRAGSMLVGMYDTAAFKMGILKEDSASNQACACIEPNESVNIVWLYYALSLMKENYLSQRRGVRQKNLNLGMIRGFELPVAEKIDQDEFVEFVEQIDKSKVAVQKALDETQTLFDSLMQEYFG